MTATFQLTLDTTGPQGVAAAIDAGAAYATARDVSLVVTTTDPDTTGYQVKVWGDVDPAADANIQTTEAASSWITLTPSMAVKLAAGDGAKNLTVRLRDDVWNPSATAADTITLTTAGPVVSIASGPDAAKVSKIAGKDTSTFSFTTDVDIVAWEVRVVPDANSGQATGTLLATTNGSTNTAGGALTAATPETVTVKGADLEAASAGDGVKQVKVFAQNAAGIWSV